MAWLCSLPEYSKEGLKEFIKLQEEIAERLQYYLEPAWLQNLADFCQENQPISAAVP